MSEIAATETKWIKNYLIPKISQKLGKSSNGVCWQTSFPENSFFLSNVYFLTLTYKSNKQTGDKSTDDTLRLVIKKPPTSSLVNAKMNMEKQFHNEILFYTKVARGSPQFPSCVYTAYGAMDETVIVTENITTLGYELCTEVYDVPLAYVLAAVEEMGRFHAVAYTMKEREPKEFNEVVNDIQEPRFLVEGAWMSEFLDIVATRPIDWLRNNNIEPAFCDKLEKHFGNAYKEIMLECVKPVEPLATLCHGDFTRNNIFFRKNEGKLEAMLFDFAVMIYASPAIDISTFLYLNAATSDRTEKFDEIFGAYHKALTVHLREAGITDLEKYSYDKFLADYKRRASFGFMVAVFFLPIIRGVCPGEIEEYQQNPELGARVMRAAGGESMTEEFGKMVLELRDTGCLNHLNH